MTLRTSEVTEGQKFCLECGTDLRSAEPELEDVYNGPEYYERPAKKTRMGRVYAGPEPMNLVYAGPDIMSGVYAAAEPVSGIDPEEKPMETLYAGPEIMNGIDPYSPAR